MNMLGSYLGNSSLNIKSEIVLRAWGIIQVFDKYEESPQYLY